MYAAASKDNKQEYVWNKLKVTLENENVSYIISEMQRSE